jgi:hypothetical protein
MPNSKLSVVETLVTPEAACPHVHTHKNPQPCPRCGTIDIPAIGPGNGPHPFRASCRHCGAHIQWVSALPLAEREARRQRFRREVMAQKPPSPAQLHLLQALGDAGPAPANMAEASERIETLKRGEAAS